MTEMIRSVQMAQILSSEWRDDADGNEFASSLVCIAASSGSGLTGVVGADALGAGPGGPVTGRCPFCSGASAVSGHRTFPLLQQSMLFHDAVPLLLSNIVVLGGCPIPHHPSKFDLLNGCRGLSHNA